MTQKYPRWNSQCLSQHLRLHWNASNVFIDENTFDSLFSKYRIVCLPWLHAHAKAGDSRDARTVPRTPRWIWRHRGVAKAYEGQPPCLDPWTAQHPARQLPPHVEQCLWLRVCKDPCRQDTSIRPPVAINDRKVAAVCRIENKRCSFEFLKNVSRSRVSLAIVEVASNRETQVGRSLRSL